MERSRKGSKRTPFAILPPAINNALAYKSASYTCRVNRARVCDLSSPFISYTSRCHCLLLKSILSLALIRSRFHGPNTPPLRWPQDSSGVGRSVRRARGRETEQDTTMEHCAHGRDDTNTRDRREKEREIDSTRRRERESFLVGSSGTKARGEAEREREKTEAAPRGGMRWGLSGRKPSAVNI